MPVTTFEGIVKNGKIQLSEDFDLPEMTKVYVIVPKIEQRKARIMSPRLKDKEKLKDFQREIIEIEEDEI